MHKRVLDTAFQSFTEKLVTNNIGKKVGGAIYISTQEAYLTDPQFLETVKSILKFANVDFEFNVLKIHPRILRLSLLQYQRFSDNPHPSLHSALTLEIGSLSFQKTDYSKSPNPPILHRKELLVGPEHPYYEEWKALTEAEEAAGLYANPHIIGHKKNWEALLKEKGLTYDDHRLVRRSDGKSALQEREIFVVQRHKTAIKRYALSKPIQTAIEHDLINQQTTVFDYGCGRGDDLKGLRQMGIAASGWDPLHCPQQPKQKADVVNLGFVLNVIEDLNERTQTLQEAYALANRLLIVSTLVATSSTSVHGRPYKDGILTRRNTFQKYFQQRELAEYIEHVLQVSPVAAGLGIYYVFRQPQDQQAFLAKRSRRVLDWDRLHRRLYPDRPEPFKTKRDWLFEKHGALLDRLWNKMVELGRLPSKEELGNKDWDLLIAVCGSLARAKHLVFYRYPQETFLGAAEERRQDLLVYLALANFKKVVPWWNLPKSLQLDVKAFFGSYKKAQQQGRDALFAIGNPNIISQLCDGADVGHLDQQALYVHRDLVPNLHPVLRIYVGAAETLYGDIHRADIIKIHKKSGKVTFLSYQQFEKNPVPELVQRVKVDLRSQRVDVFDHQTGSQQQLLYFKERFVAPDHPLRAKWEKYSRKLKKLGLHEEMGFGPSKQEFLTLLEQHGLTIHLNKKKA